MALSSGGPVLAILETGKSYFDKECKGNDLLPCSTQCFLNMKSHSVCSGVKQPVNLLCQARKKVANILLMCGDVCDRNKLLFRVMRTGAEVTGQQFQEKQKPGEGNQ